MSGTPGSAIIRASWIGTALFVVTAVSAVLAPDLFELAAWLVAVTLFAVGTVAFLWAYLVAIGRSRTDAIGIGGLYFLQGSAPPGVQVRLLVPIGVQVVVGLVTASLRPYTSLAFGVLVAMYGLGLAGLWGARHGEFAPRGLPAVAADED